MRRPVQQQEQLRLLRLDLRRKPNLQQRVVHMRCALHRLRRYVHKLEDGRQQLRHVRLGVHLAKRLQQRRLR
jgi:hypothetical protein